MANADCVHHFIIEPPEGRYSLGECKKCGLGKRFTNSPSAVAKERTNNESIFADRVGLSELRERLSHAEAIVGEDY